MPALLSIIVPYEHVERMRRAAFISTDSSTKYTVTMVRRFDTQEIAHAVAEKLPFIWGVEELRS